MKPIFRSAKAVGRLAIAASLIGVLMTTDALAEDLKRTPPQVQGPFYPDRLPRDTDNDLTYVNDNTRAAVGVMVHLSGRVLDGAGEPVPNAVIEIWQVDGSGVYFNSNSPNRSSYDQNFQGFGRTLTNPNGEYYFRTIKPVTTIENRQRRAAHIHFAVFSDGRAPIFTQMYLEGDPLNGTDPILNSISDEGQRASVIVSLEPVENTDRGDVRASFDIVLR